MLYVVLLLVLAALGLLVPALTSSSSIWAWASVGTSTAAAVVLFLDWLRHRSPAPIVDQHAVVGDQRVVTSPRSDTPLSPSDPSEEDTDAADLLTVADLTDEVRVLDEHPRYHLAACSWLAGRPTLGLPVQEARQLGFSACGICRPDSTLATKHRASR